MSQSSVQFRNSCIRLRLPLFFVSVFSSLVFLFWGIVGSINNVYATDTVVLSNDVGEEELWLTGPFDGRQYVVAQSFESNTPFTFNAAKIYLKGIGGNFSHDALVYITDGLNGNVLASARVINPEISRAGFSENIVQFLNPIAVPANTVLYLNVSLSVPYDDWLFTLYSSANPYPSGNIFMRPVDVAVWWSNPNADLRFSLLFTPNPLITLLQQMQTDMITSIAENSVTLEDGIVFQAILRSPVNNPVRLEVELRKFTDPFTGNDDGGILRSDFVPSDQDVFVSRSGVSDGKYHWRARTIDDEGNSSPWREFGVPGNADFEIYTSMVQLSQLVAIDESISSHYQDNWYQLGRGVPVTIRSLTLRGRLTHADAYYWRRVYLQEFNDARYLNLNQTYLISEDAPFTSEEKEITFEGLNITLKPDKFYRLLTMPYRQNASIILRGTNAFGVAMYNSFVWGQGRTEYWYTFYPYIAINKTRDPVIIIPGIMGTRLNRATPRGEEIWPNIGKMANPLTPQDDYLDELKLATTGQSFSDKPVMPSTIIDKILVISFYENLISSLKELGYTENENLFTVPYDWRLGIQNEIDRLTETIGRAASTSSTGKVNIIAHSMGGLLAKEYLLQNPQAPVNKLILVGVPNLGTPKVFKILNYGDDLDMKFLIFGLNQNKSKDISQNMPSVYQLLPSRKYVNVAGPYVFDFRNNLGALSYDQAKELMRADFPIVGESRNAFLLDNADTFHQERDDWLGDPQKLYLINGCQNMKTIGSFRIYEDGKVDILAANGDGTVPFLSAASIPNFARRYFVTLSDHLGLVKDDSPLTLIKNILDDRPDDPVVDAFQFPGACFAPSLIPTQWIISTHSPVELHLYDSLNRHLGPTLNGDIEIGIPGSTYERILENSFAFVPSGDTYRILINATDTGSFDLKITGINGTEIGTSTTYLSIPLISTSTEAELMFTDFSGDLTLNIDENGDNIIDTSLQPDAILSASGSLDIIPPTTTISLLGTLGNNNWYTSDVQISLSAQDNEGGSGVFRTEYSLDNGQTWYTYTTPFTIASEEIYTILYRSQDYAGNPESTQSQEIKIDKTPPEAKIYFDKDNKTLKIEGVDNLSSTQVTQGSPVFTIQDEAGHTLKLVFEEIEQKNKKINVELQSLKYDSGPIIQVAETELEFKWALNQDRSIRSLMQQIEVENQFEIRAEFNGRKNETEIKVKTKGKKETKQTLPGLVIIKLITKAGELDHEF